MAKKIVAIEQPEVSQVIRQLRHLTGLSQEQFAERLGVAFSTINRWENGHIQPSSLALKQIKMMLRELSCSSIVDLREKSQALLDQYFSDGEPDVR